jgi:superfamily II DNA or RNA helicase
LFRLVLASRLTPLAQPGQVLFRSDQFTTSASISGSFTADLRFSTAPQQVCDPQLTIRLFKPVFSYDRETSVLPLGSNLCPASEVLCSAATLVRVEPALDPVSVFSQLALFMPHFRVEGKNYSEAERDISRPPGTHAAPRAGAGSPAATRGGGRPQGIAISKWDALWPLLQPPLNFAFPESLDFPSDLRPYQIDGVRFLADRERALLGDDMGTGKTVQAVVALRILVQKGKVRRALIVSPLAVLSSWDRHVRDWGRILNCVVVRGNKNERKLQWCTPAHVYIATYDTFREDCAWLRDESETPEFDLVVADEVQKIKNSATAISKAMRSIEATRRWGLSATPFENRPEELVSVFGFLKPGVLLRDREDAHSIRQKIAPYFLRRTKDVLKGELPEKTHELLWLDLGQNQRRAYELAEKQGVVELEKQGERVTVSHVLALLQKLKQLCNFEPRSGESVKLEVLREELEDVSEQGNKALVFSQFKDFGVTRIKTALAQQGCLEYTGDLSFSQRERTLNQFNTDASFKVMLCTQAAAGLGLNLTAANYVFHFDHWWNPARTAQAEDRVHRIGQTKPVVVYHFWVKNTVEERIYKILEKKRAQFEEVIGPMSNSEGTGLSEEELFEVFGLKRTRSQRPVTSPSEPPREQMTVQPSSPEIPDVDVWPLIRKTELALRKCVRELLVQRYGSKARDRVLAHLGTEEAERISQTVAQYRRRYSGSADDFAPSEDPLDYTYLKQMMRVISQEWQLFQPIFKDRKFIDNKVSEIAVVRNDEAHFRGIPPVEKMRAYVACSDLLARLQLPFAEK